MHGAGVICKRYYIGENLFAPVGYFASERDCVCYISSKLPSPYLRGSFEDVSGFN